MAVAQTLRLELLEMRLVLLPNPALFDLISYLPNQNKVFKMGFEQKAEMQNAHTAYRISNRVHSHYSRTVQYLPMADFAIILHVCVRCFFCDNPSCLI